MSDQWQPRGLGSAPSNQSPASNKSNGRWFVLVGAMLSVAVAVAVVATGAVSFEGQSGEAVDAGETPVATAVAVLDPTPVPTAGVVRQIVPTPRPQPTPCYPNCGPGATPTPLPQATPVPTLTPQPTPVPQPAIRVAYSCSIGVQPDRQVTVGELFTVEAWLTPFEDASQRSDVPVTWIIDHGDGFRDAANPSIVVYRSAGSYQITAIASHQGIVQEINCGDPVHAIN